MAISLAKPAPVILDKVLLDFLDSREVMAELEARGAQFTRVTFLKNDGTVTSRLGRPKTYSRRVDHATATQESINRSNAASESLAKRDAIFLDYPQPVDGKNGFSFTIDRVLGIGDAGVHVGDADPDGNRIVFA